MYVLFFPTLKVRKIKSNPSFSKIQLRKQVIRTLPKAARQSYGEIKRSGPKSVTLTLKFTKQDRDLVRRSKRAVSAGSHPPKPSKLPSKYQHRPVHQRASLLARPADWTYKHQAWGAGSRLKNGVIDQEEIRERVELTQKSSEIMVVPCCANQFLVVFGITWVQHGSAPRMVTLSWAEGSQLIRLGAASDEPIVLRILRTGCYLEPPGSYRCLTSWNVHWENHVVCASKTWQTTDTTMITKCETRPAAGMR